MELLAFFGTVVLISLSGVLMPGPVTAVTIGFGMKRPHAGALVAVGHGLVEFPLILAIFYGMGNVFSTPVVRLALLGGGGFLLAWMGFDMLRSLLRLKVEVYESGRSPLMTGVILSATNPYFILWWFTVGSALVATASGMGWWAFLAFALVHWLCDLGWYWFLSAVAHRGGSFFGTRFQKAVFAVCGVFLVFCGSKFIYDAIDMVRGMYGG